MADEIEPQDRPVVTRRAAFAAAMKRYFTGRRCKSGHLTERYTISGSCVACQKVANGNFHIYYKKHAEKIKSRALARIAAHPEYSKNYYAANREKAKADAAAWRASNSERVRATAAIYYAKSGNKRREFYAANKERIAARAAAWKASHKEAHRIQSAARRALKIGAKGTFTAADAVFLMKVQRGKCAHSWCRADLTNSHHQDHIIALSRGGPHDRKNMQLLCPTCNQRKHAKHPIDFAQENGMLL